MDDYAESAVRRLLAEDPRAADLAIRIERHGDHLKLCGEVESPERREQIAAVVAEAFPDLTVHNDLGVTRTHPPHDVEDLS